MIPFFSIIIPTYNRGYIIDQTLLNILQQTFDDFEIIVVDDGSTDNTKDVVGELAAAHQNIHYCFKENGERGAARNLGLENAKGKYLVFFDSDDIMLPNHLQTLYDQIVVLQEEVRFIASKYCFVYEDGKVASSAIQPFEQGWYDYKLFLNGNHLACNFCVKSDNPNLIRFEEDRNYAILEDWMFLVENLKNDRLYLIDEVTIRMRKHDDRSMGNHQTIVTRRLKANDYLLNRVGLSEKEAKYMTAHSYYFCAIHAYLDHQRGQALKLMNKAISLIGLNTLFMTLYAKILVGKKTIDLVRR